MLMAISVFHCLKISFLLRASFPFYHTELVKHVTVCDRLADDMVSVIIAVKLNVISEKNVMVIPMIIKYIYV